jgi:hypothetical protein
MGGWWSCLLGGSVLLEEALVCLSSLGPSRDAGVKSWYVYVYRGIGTIHRCRE